MEPTLYCDKMKLLLKIAIGHHHRSNLKVCESAKKQLIIIWHPQMI